MDRVGPAIDAAVAALLVVRVESAWGGDVRAFLGALSARGGDC